MIEGEYINAHVKFNLKNTFKCLFAQLPLWRCVRNGKELDNHMIRQKREEYERIEKDREG